MRRGGGKQKGNSFERELCKVLSLWITHGKMDDVLWRSAMSGGRATVHAKKNKKLAHVAGDICATHSAGEAFVQAFFVELKFYKDLGFAALVTKNEGILAEFWRIAVERAAEFGKYPMLIFKQNQMPIMVGLSVDGFDALQLPGRRLAPPQAEWLAEFPALDLTVVSLNYLTQHEWRDG